MSEIVARDAWKAVTGQLEERLQISVEGGVEVIGIVGAPGTGKSTGLTAHVRDLVHQGRAPGPVTYVLSTEVEADIIGNWLHRNAEQIGVEQDIRVTTIRGGFQDGGGIPSQMTFLLDVSWYPDVDDEVFYAKLARNLRTWRNKAATEDVRIALVLLMSVFESKRTTELFRRAVGTSSVHVYEYTYSLSDISIKMLSKHWTKTSEVSGVAKPSVTYGGRVIMAVDNDLPPGFNDGEDLSEVCEEVELGSSGGAGVKRVLNALEKSPVLMIEADIKYSTIISMLRLFVSSGVASDKVVLDRDMIQPVFAEERPLEYCELLRQLSWVIKSERPLSGIQFMATWDHDDLVEKKGKGAVDLVESFGHAWNRDLILLVLAVVDSCPDQHFHRMPFRTPVSDYSWAEMVKRLELVGCIVKLGPGKYKSTGRGQGVLHYHRKYGIDFHASFLLAYVTMGYIDSTVLRIVIRIAALASCGLDHMFSVRGKREAPMTESEFGFYSPPLTRFKAHHGTIWFALSLYLKGEMERLYDLDKSPENEGIGEVAKIGTVIISRHEFKMAKRLIQALDRDFQLPEEDHAWMSMPLTEEQIKTIDRGLMWSWMHRMVWLQARPKPTGTGQGMAMEITSSKECTVNLYGGSETLDAVRLREENAKERAGTGIAAIYMKLHVDKEKKVSASMLTSIPGHCFEEFNKETKLTWPSAVANANMF